MVGSLPEGYVRAAIVGLSLVLLFSTGGATNAWPSRLGLDVAMESSRDSMPLPRGTIPTVGAQGGQTYTLYGSMSGWGFAPENISNPGPTLRALPNGSLTLLLFSEDGITHNWFIDLRGTASPSPSDPVSPDFSSPTSSVSFTFTVPPHNGTWYYRCAYHPSAMVGEIVIGVGGPSSPPQPKPFSITTFDIEIAGAGVALLLLFTYILGGKMAQHRRHGKPGESHSSEATTHGPPASP